VTGHDNGNVILWDYSLHRPVLSFFVSEFDDRTKEVLQQLRAVEKLPEFKGPKEAEAQMRALERSKTGALRVVRFFDSDVQKALYLLSVRTIVIDQHEVEVEFTRSIGSPSDPRQSRLDRLARDQSPAGSSSSSTPAMPSTPTGNSARGDPSSRSGSASSSASLTPLKPRSPTFGSQRIENPPAPPAMPAPVAPLATITGPPVERSEISFWESSWIVVILEHRIMLFNYTTQEHLEIRLSDLDNKPQAACCPLGIGARIAFGGTLHRCESECESESESALSAHVLRDRYDAAHDRCSCDGDDADCDADDCNVRCASQARMESFVSGTCRSPRSCKSSSSASSRSSSCSHSTYVDDRTAAARGESEP